ncbi:Crp/Fnr family transcriptional regulator [Flavobacterium sp. J27]|uniref:Crp/Fnr family transcriptional regulator n=1 Tax=Flavobacterium sp. J27 TaxID=2060419 RepID=UPI0010302ED6|nr:Crp/Fnr family transcriptional regulator [Flavobacterium sp. J27]
MLLDTILDTIYPLSSTSKLLFKQISTEVSFPKGHIVLRANKMESSIYFIKKGIVRIYTTTLDNEITFLFCKEGDPIISMKSYVLNEKGYEDIELLEESTLYEINAIKLQELFEKDIQIANWGRKFAEIELIKTEERLLAQQFKTATERYKELLKNNPEVIQRVQLGYIASYLGITQVTLSRIRAELK